MLIIVWTNLARLGYVGNHQEDFALTRQPHSRIEISQVVICRNILEQLINFLKKTVFVPNCVNYQQRELEDVQRLADKPNVYFVRG